VALVALIAAAGLIVAFLKMSKERAAEREREKPVAAEPQVKRGTNGEVTLTLDADTQKRIGLKIEALAPKQIHAEIKGYGHVLDPAPLAMLVSELASARVTAEASRLEFERVKTLAGQNNTSARALQGPKRRRDVMKCKGKRSPNNFSPPGAAPSRSEAIWLISSNHSPSGTARSSE